jgi:hypothetical protein
VAGTANVFIDAITEILSRGGVPMGLAPDDTPALARALCWMIERSFYQSSKISLGDLEHAKQACQAVWLRMASTR